MKNKINYNKWEDYVYSLEDNYINKDVICISLSLLFKEKFTNLVEKQMILIIFRIILTTGEFRTISYLQVVNKSSLNSLVEIFGEYWNLKLNNYINEKIDDIIYSYKILSLDSPIKDVKILSVNDSNLIPRKRINHLQYHGHNLPLTMDFSLWGDIIFKSQNSLNEDFFDGQVIESDIKYLYTALTLGNIDLTDEVKFWLNYDNNLLNYDKLLNKDFNNLIYYQNIYYISNDNYNISNINLKNEINITNQINLIKINYEIFFTKKEFNKILITENNVINNEINNSLFIFDSEIDISEIFNKFR